MERLSETQKREVIVMMILMKFHQNRRNLKVQELTI